MARPKHPPARSLLLVCGLALSLGGCVDAIQALLSSGTSADPAPAATVPAPTAPPTKSWSDARSSQRMDLKISEHNGPVWTIALYALGSKSKATKEAEKLRKKSWNGHIANLATYGSANNKALWLVYVGPYGLDEEDQLRTDLASIQKKVRKKAYAVTIGPHGTRSQFSDPGAAARAAQPKPAPPPAASRPSSGGGISEDAKKAYGCCNMCGGVFSVSSGCSPNSTCYGRCLFGN